MRLALRRGSGRDCRLSRRLHRPVRARPVVLPADVAGPGPRPPREWAARYSYSFCKDGGDVWDFKSHLDCKAMAEADFDMMPNDYWEGIPALAENDGILEELDSWRGRFPHVVCRIELHEQLYDARNPY